MAQKVEKSICYYKFPCHPADMFADSPASLSNDDKRLRAYMIQHIVMLSQHYSEEILNGTILIDIQNGIIVGMDTSKLTLKINNNMCIGDKIISLGQMTEYNWKTMRA